MTPRIEELRAQLVAAKAQLTHAQTHYAQNPTTQYAGHVTSKANEVARVARLLEKEMRRAV